jgi:hypothetical protein
MSTAQEQAGEPRNASPLMTATWEAATTDPDPLAALGASRALIGLLSTWEARLAAEAVAAGATWESVGMSVGVSRQAAWERFHGEVDEFRSHVKHEARSIRDRQRKEWDAFKVNVKAQAQARHRPKSSPDA